MRGLLLLVPVGAVLLGCGSGESTPSGAGGSGGSSSSQGGNGGSAGAAGSSVMEDPEGQVASCWGTTCPNGECDDTLQIADVICTDAYPDPIAQGSALCAPSLNGSHCFHLQAGGEFDYWVVYCDDGVVNVYACDSGCYRPAPNELVCL